MAAEGIQYVELSGELRKFLSSPPMLETSLGAFTQAVYSGGSAKLGSLIAGPPGLLIGCIVGSVAGYATSRDYDSAIIILCRLDEDSRNRVINELISILIDAGALLSAADVKPEEFVEALNMFATREGWKKALSMILAVMKRNAH
mmetsp:Transcript_12360/g.17972  ORF Transcript_12360/g.17972 Transcript_12360/m.17972 type:complete len:145 (-) Transcript_12360:128-562(-)